MKKNSLWKRILSLAAAFSLCAACAPAALANADPSAPQGDTLAGAVTEPEDFADTSLQQALVLEAGDGISMASLPENAAEPNVQLNLWICQGNNANRTYQTGVQMSWREALAGIVNAEVGGFYTAISDKGAGGGRAQLSAV